MFKDKVVLITGGTGFLGRTLIDEILKQEPKSIRVFSRDEVKHHIIQEKFQEEVFDGPIRNLIGDVRDYERLKKAMNGCDIVIHAAALKRIDLIEYNVEEAIKTNILGTLNVVRACLENNVKKAVFVSTDKACSPVNTYGACKFVGERTFIESNYSKGKGGTAFICVRYGNVINSTGSVIPFFIDKLKRKKDLTITDERMTRFLITPKQAAHLIFDAIKHGKGGEVFVPKIPSCRIIDLAEFLREKYNPKSKIKLTGIRPGEKLHELMINESESSRTIEIGRNLVILSEIEKYHKEEGRLDRDETKLIEFKEFNSKENILDGEDLKRYFDLLDL